MSDTLASIRRANRMAQSAARRTLRHKMQAYNSLSRKPQSIESEYDASQAKTTNDVINETLAIAKRQQQNARRGRFSVVQDSTDKLLRECNVVTPEVRTLWQQKIGMHSMLTDENRKALRETTNKLYDNESDEARNIRLAVLARWMVNQWCDVEGYDPEKHVK